MLRGTLAVALWCVGVGLTGTTRPARAQGPGPGQGQGQGQGRDPRDDGYLVRLAAAVRARLAEAAGAHVARLVPPVPVKPQWKPQKLGSLDLGAPLVAVAAADLDGDGKAELYLVTSREVIAVGVAGKLRELGRVAFTGEPAVPAPRDVVGTAVVDGAAVIAGVSAWAKDLRVEWRGKALTARHGAGGFRLCGDRVQLAAGRNHFRDGGAALFGARCRDDLTDPTGAPLHVRGELSITGSLEVTVARCAASGKECQPAGAYQVHDVGVAFEIADVDRDGTPDAVVSSASAPGDADAVRVIALGTPGAKPMYKKQFNGGVAGIAVADGDGDGVPEIIAVVRLAGATRVDVWRLD
jgi:hypothetical protein